MEQAHRVGDTVPVFVQRRGTGRPTLRGEIVLEDLDPILERIASRSGSNGPQSEVTQWILAQAARHLAEELTRDISPRPAGDSLPRVFSSLIGHEPFVKQILDVSIHQMNRRWPQASDWYYDLIAYIMRPQRYARNFTDILGELPTWTQLTLGQLTKAFGEFELSYGRDPLLYGLADVIETLWPDHPQVKANHERAQQLITQQWGSLYQFALPIYGVRLRTGVTVGEVVWSIQALASWDMREEHIRLSPPRYADPIDGADRPHCSRASMIYLAGAVENLDGSLLSLEDLYRRTPVAVPGWPVG